jgi:hypothetical protein
LASTSERLLSRRALLSGALLSPPAALALAASVEATDYGSALEVFEAIDRLEADVAARLRAIRAALPSSSTFAEAVLATHVEHRRRRAELRRRLRLAAAPAAGEGVAEDRELAALRAAQQALVHAHAEGLPALGEPAAVAELARHMVVLSRQLTVIDLWIEAEQARG